MGRKRARSKALVRARKRGTATGFQSGGGGGEAAAGDNAQAADAAEAGFGFDSAPARPVSNRHADGECALSPDEIEAALEREPELQSA